MSDLENVMERIGRLVALDRTLAVQVRGTQAYSVPGRVVIPRIESFASLGANAERMLHGLLDHECAHAKFTTHSVMERARRKGGEALGTLLNAIEDGRCEREIGKLYVGAKQNLRAKNRWFWTRADGAPPLSSLDPFSAYCLAMTMWLRGDVSLAEIREAHEPTAALIEETRSLGLDDVEALRSTEDCFVVAERIFARLAFPPPPPPPPSPKPDEDDEPEDENDDSEDDSEGDEGDGDDGGDSEDDGDEEGSEGASGDEEGSEDDEGASEGAAGSEDDSDGEDDSEDAAGSEGGSEGDEGDEEGSTGSEASEGDSEDDGGTEEGGGGLLDPYADIREVPLREWKPTGDVVNPETAISQLLAQALDDQPYVTFDPEAFDSVRDFSAQPPSIPVEAERAMRIESIDGIANDARPASAALAQAFEAAFRARTERRPMSGHDEGEIDVPMLVEFATGSASSDTIYTQFVAEEEQNVAVAIMLDCSGSMEMALGRKQGRSHLARRAAFAMSEALSQVHIPHEITGFTTWLSRPDKHPWFLEPEQQGALASRGLAMRNALTEAENNGSDLSLLTREFHRSPYYKGRMHSATLQAATYAVFKSYDISTLDALRYARGYAENLDGEAVLWQARRLAHRPERRRVMIVLSDGMPAGTHNDRVTAEYLKTTVARVMEAGIEVYGVGIETDAVKHFYPRHWIANSVQHLVDVAMGSMVEVLLDGRTERECVRF